MAPICVRLVRSGVNRAEESALDGSHAQARFSAWFSRWGAQRIGRSSLSILEKDGTVTYFLGSDNYFSHPKGDKQSERFVLTSLMENGHVRARDLEEAPLVIPHRTLMNWKVQYRKDGPASFFRTFDGPKPRVMTPEKIAECATMLAGGVRPAECAQVARRAVARR